MANVALNQAVTGGVASTSFFNGRLLSAEDLLAEQTSNRQARQILGQAIGDGVAWGLFVSESTLGSPSSSPTVSISAGVAVSRSGLGLRLTQGVDVLLTTPPDPAAVPSTSGFSACQPPQQGVYITGEGVYLLVISPASFKDGQAPANGFGGINSACTTRSVVNTVQFRLLPLPGADLSDGNKARNRIAYQCTAAASLVDAASDPYGPGVTRTSLIDNLRPAFLTDCDVPLAVISWSILGGIRFVDNWSVRRRLTSRLEQGAFLNLARRLETEAMIAQFDDQIRTMAGGKRICPPLRCRTALRPCLPSAWSRCGPRCCSAGSTRSSFSGTWPRGTWPCWTRKACARCMPRR